MPLVRRIVNRLSRSYPVRLVLAYATSQAGNYASGLAFTAFVSMFPLMLGLIAIIGFAVGDTRAESQFAGALLNFFPADQQLQTALTKTLQGIHRYSGVFGIIGLLGLLWSGSSLFTGLEWTLGRIVGAGQRDFLRQRAMALVMTLLFTVVVVAVVGLNAALALAGGVSLLGPVAGAVLWIVFMLVVYRAVPNRTYTVTKTLPGAALAGVLMEALTLVWPLYTRLVHGFSTYGAIFALFFVLATWLYFWAQFLLLGAVAIRMRSGTAETLGLIASPEPGAQAISSPGNEEAGDRTVKVI